MSEPTATYTTDRDQGDERPKPAVGPISDANLARIRGWAENADPTADFVGFVRLEILGMIARLDQAERERDAAMQARNEWRAACDDARGKLFEATAALAVSEAAPAIAPISDAHLAEVRQSMCDLSSQWYPAPVYRVTLQTAVVNGLLARLDQAERARAAFRAALAVSEAGAAVLRQAMIRTLGLLGTDLDSNAARAVLTDALNTDAGAAVLAMARAAVDWYETSSVRHVGLMNAIDAMPAELRAALEGKA